jgi:Signal peptidase, peptidase S26
MSETPEDSPPASPVSQPAENGLEAEGAPGREPRARRRGVPKLAGDQHEPPAREWPTPLADERRHSLTRALGHSLTRALHGTWRVAVEEDSMAPALASGDWLLIDPTCDRWPRRGSIVVFREPDTGILAIKRVAARTGDRVRIKAGILHLGPDEAWLLGDSASVSLDSRRYGPVALKSLVGRAWFRYGPTGRIGRLGRGRT